MPTRNRPVHAAACIASILATTGFVDLIVVDQSDDRATEDALSKIDDTRLRYVRMEASGVTSGRNLGMRLSESEIIAFTDDDCRVRPDWVARIVDVFVSDADAAVVCGRVSVPKEIQHLGWAESFQPRVREWQGRYPPIGDWGITANLSLRRSVMERVGPFDPTLGAGAPLRSGGEPDFLFRVLRARFKVVNAQEVIVDHLGIRQRGDQARNLIRGYGAGTAAALFKHVRLGDPEGMMVYLRFFLSTVFRVSTNVMLRRRPTGAGFLLAFLSGTIASCRFRVDRQRRQYVARDDAIRYFSETARQFQDPYHRQPEFHERWRIWIALLDRYAARDGLSLDIGCGPGIFSFYLAEMGGRVVGIDGAADMVELCEAQRHERGFENVRFVQARLPVVDESDLANANLIISSSVVEYIDDLDATLALFARLLKPGGVLVISIPNGASLSRGHQRLRHALTRTPGIYQYIRHFSSPAMLHRRVCPYGLALSEAHYYTHVTRLAKLGRALRLPVSLTADLFVAVFRKS